MNLPRATLRWAIGLSSALLISACTPAGPFDPIIAGSVTAQTSTSPTPRILDEVVAGNATVIYRVDVPNARDLLYVEAEGSNLRVSLLSASGTTLGVSISPTYFASSVSGLGASVAGTTETGVKPQAIDVAFVCVGPCVATRVSAATYYLKVENRGAGAQTFDVYAYTFDENDTNEPNDTTAGATPVAGEGSVIGAIETVNDVDWFVYTGASVRALAFAEYDPPLGLFLEIENRPTLQDGDAEVIYPGERFRVRSPASLAGPAGTSGYVVTVGAVVADAIDETVSAVATTSPSPLLSDSVGASQTRTYRVNVPSPRELLYAEAEGFNLRVTIKTLAGATLAVSQDPDFFGPSVTATGATAGAIGPASIAVAYVCVGPCVAVRPAASAYIVEVRNLAGSTQAFDFYAYTFNHNDTNEPNDSAASATVVPGQGTAVGAIETVGDVDWFIYTGTSARSLAFNEFDPPLGLSLEVENGPTLVDGGTDLIFPNERFRVRSPATLAGPAGTSGYTVTVGSIVVTTLDGTYRPR